MNTENKTTFNINSIEIGVRDINIMANFYEDSLKLKEVKPREANKVYLGDNNKVLIVLYADKNLKDRVEKDSGLYHIALVYPTKFKLARVINNVYNNYPKLFSGTADHIETEAFYFSDPEGNGLELDYDKPKEEWEYDENGNAKMGVRELNVQDFFDEALKNEDDSGSIKIGHIHLKGGNIEDGKKFYIDNLMFDLIKQDQYTLFTTIDGYHHRLAINNWESAGAEKRTKNTIGLISFSLEYENKDFFEKVISNLQKNNYNPIEINNNEYSVEDPWGNLIYLQSN